MNVMREIRKINERELELNVSDTASWHADYRNSAYIFIGGLSPELSEGDVIVMFSQFGEVVDLHLPRRPSADPSALGARLGFAFLAFEDQRSTVLAIDNMNGWEMKLPGETRPRFLRVDHAGKYRRPKGAAAGGGGAEEKTFDDVETNDAAYDERRRKIWDYAKYGTLDDGRRRTLAVGELPDFDDLTSAGAGPGPARAAHVDASDSREDAKHADRVMAMLAEKKKQRERARMGGDDQNGGGGGAGAAAAAAASSSSYAPAAASRGTTVGVDGQRRFGDQLVNQPSVAAAAASSSSAAPSSSSSSARRSHSSRSPRRSSHSHRDRDREHKHKSRSRSRERKKDRKRSRSRDRESSRR